MYKRDCTSEKSNDFLFTLFYGTTCEKMGAKMLRNRKFGGKMHKKLFE